jgi:two-component system, sensor histidine kinase
LGLFATAAMKKNVRLTCRLDDAVPALLIGDEARLRQILFNLVGNALKFTETGQVDVDVRPLADTPDGTARLLFTVSDTGVGIPDNQLSCVLDPFVQVERAYTRHFQGAGLGLSIVRRLVTLMGGTLAIDNGGDDDQGTIICVALPFARADASPDERDTTDLMHPSPHPSRILVVEDDPVSLNVARRTLTRAGHTVVTAGNGDQALDLLAREPFDLMLVDVQLPVRSGLETVAALRQATDLAGDNARLPVIAMTAYAMAGDKEKFLAAGMNAYLAKPLPLRVLLALVERIRETPEAFPPGGPA